MEAQNETCEFFCGQGKNSTEGRMKRRKMNLHTCKEQGHINGDISNLQKVGSKSEEKALKYK